MKPKILLAVTCGVLCVKLTSSLTAQSTPPPIVIAQSVTQSQWQEFSSPEGKFVVTMPGIPKLKSENFSGRVLNHTLKFAKGKELYLVRYFDVDSVLTPTDIKLTLNSVVATFVVGANSKLIEERDISINNYPGKEFEFESLTPEQPPGIGQVFIVDRRIYGIVVTTPEPDNAQKFIQSFRLL
ncbi:MAG TPA: hypothetical protein VK211_26905 [Kamptonema sp.]|nr:hypothetical protein [Kamptonema sp.]